LLRFGVNYTPRRRWFHAWLDFDPDEVREDLTQVAELGLDHVRVFPLWPLLQPNRTVIRQEAVDQLLALVDVAAECGLDVAVDALQGHLSSFDFYPSWTQTWHARNVFTDPDVVEAQVALLRRLGAALGTRPNVFCLQLGNEMNNLVEHNPATVAEVDRWLDALLAAASEALPGRLVTHSSFDAAWYADDHPFTGQASARKGAVTTVHPWVFTGNCAHRYGALSVPAVHLAEYGVEIAKAYADQPHRPVWVQELGAPQPHVPVADAPEFARRSIRNLVDCPGVWGVTWWCSHDVDRELADFPPLEYTLGLIDSTGAVKPIGHAVAHTIAQLRADPPTPAARTTALVLECNHANRSVSGPGGGYFETWMGLRAAGNRLGVVLAERADDPAYLAARGIEQLLWP
jgi:endo-1,4-beta-mannosidase